MTTSASLSALMKGVIDYAGMFPPARLALIPAFENFLQYRVSAESWMLSRFVLPVDQIDALTAHFDAALRTASPSLRFTVLARASEPESFAVSLAEDAAKIAAFSAAYGDSVMVDSIEVRVPGTLDRSGLETVRQCIARARSTLKDTQTFFEIAPGTDWEEVQRAACEAIALSNQNADVPNGFKVRTGGTRAEEIPSAEKVAYAIVCARDAKIPMKFTAGLHQPFRHRDAALNTTVHGFVNVFAAGIMARLHGLDWINTQRIVQDSDPSHFTFTDTALRWQDLTASPDEINNTRAQFVTTFGSCSFDEPRDELRALRLMID